MSVAEWTAVIGAFLGIMAAVYSAIRFMIKGIMAELSPNNGSSLRDQVNRIENRLDSLYEKLYKN